MQRAKIDGAPHCMSGVMMLRTLAAPVSVSMLATVFVPASKDPPTSGRAHNGGAIAQAPCLCPDGCCGKRALKNWPDNPKRPSHALVLRIFRRRVALDRAVAYFVWGV